MTDIRRYLRICAWARARYTVDGVLPWYVGGNPAPMARIEMIAFARYAPAQTFALSDPMPIETSGAGA